MKRTAVILAISPDGIQKKKKFIRESRLCIFFKYLLGTFHVLKTLASLKISRTFLFKYSKCVGCGGCSLLLTSCLWEKPSVRDTTQVLLSLPS